MIRNHNYYFSSDEFCMRYRENFKFVFPHKFEQTHMFDMQMGTYVVSPMFDMCFREVGN